MKIFTDDDLQTIDLSKAAQALRRFVTDAAAGRTISPARHGINLDPDHLILTAGGDAAHFGFRSYSTRPGLIRAREDQLVAAWCRETHRLRAIAVGDMEQKSLNLKQNSLPLHQHSADFEREF
ncbi:MAG: hypothetical protein CR993_07795 [Rhodobacterales bacterium]|nr:MAG: hypothetical protein CR993_07795 [Rhodobacterales bacterium]